MGNSKVSEARTLILTYNGDILKDAKVSKNRMPFTNHLPITISYAIYHFFKTAKEVLQLSSIGDNRCMNSSNNTPENLSNVPTNSGNYISNQYDIMHKIHD